MQWIREPAPTWDAGKQRLVGDAPAGIFELAPLGPGQAVPGEWWRVEQDGRLLGYGWMDVVWGDGEILLAVAPEARGRGVGAFILERLEAEARARGLRTVYNSVRPSHPRREEVTSWLMGHGFAASDHGERLARQVA